MGHHRIFLLFLYIVVRLKSGLRLYPNPATDKIYLTLNSTSTAKAKIIIADAQGRIVHQQEQMLNLNSNVIAMNVEHLSPGIYFIHVSGTGIKDYTAKKFYKEIDAIL